MARPTIPVKLDIDVIQRSPTHIACLRGGLVFWCERLFLLGIRVACHARGYNESDTQRVKLGAPSVDEMS